MQLRKSGNGWMVLYHDTKKGKIFQFQTDYTVIATGLYDKPFLPEVEVCSPVPLILHHDADRQCSWGLGIAGMQ